MTTTHTHPTPTIMKKDYIPTIGETFIDNHGDLYRAVENHNQYFNYEVIHRPSSWEIRIERCSTKFDISHFRKIDPDIFQHLWSSTERRLKNEAKAYDEAYQKIYGHPQELPIIN